MTKTIALAGKGGTGKTTVAALLIRSITQRTSGPLLAIDADPAANLHLALGLPMPTTVGDIREKMTQEAQTRALGVAISRLDYLNQEIRMALEEGEEVDLLAMGRPEGQGCYCAANHMLRQILDQISTSYPYVVMDNEAGMEHISRRTTNDVDMLLLVTDPTVRGVKTAEAMAELADEVEVRVKDTLLIVNRVTGELPHPLREAIDRLDFSVAAMIPADEQVNYLDAIGEPLIALDGDSPAYQAVEAMVDQILSRL